MKKKMLIAVVVGTLTSGIVSPIIGYAATNEFLTKESRTETLVTEEETVDTSEEETTISSETEESTETTTSSEEPVKEVAPIISEIEQPNIEVSTSEITVVKN